MNTKLSSSKDFITVCVLALLSFGVYFNSLNAPFIFDDYHMIEENTFIKNPKYFGMFFKGYVTSYPIPKGMCRPLLMLTFAFNYLNGGLNPVGYHIVNILFHFLNATLLYSLLKLLKKEAPWGLVFLITLLFVVHPINTEAVTYVSSRSDLMVTFFILCAFILYLKGKYIFSVICYALSLLTKESALIYPILIGGHFFLYTPYQKKYAFKNKRFIILLLFIIIITVSYLLYKTLYFESISTGNLKSLLFNILLQSWVSFFYLRLFLWPNNLNLLHISPYVTSFFQLNVFLPFIGIIIFIILTFILRKKHRLLSFGIFFYLVGLLPKFYATLKIPAMEHHFYLSSIGGYIFLLTILERVYLKNKRYFLYCSLGIILILSTFTIERNHQLNMPLLVWKIGTEKESLHMGNWLNLGVVYKEQGNFKKAKEIFLKALNIPTKNIDYKIGVYLNLAETCILEGKYEKAIKYLNTALKLKPNQTRMYQLYNIFATLYEKKGKKKKAIEYINRVIKLNPYYAYAYQRLTKLSIGENNLKTAKKYIEKALEINPYDFYSYFLKGKIYEKEEKLKEAENLYKKSIELKNNWFYSHYCLSIVYIKLKNSSFIEELEETLKLNPQFTPALRLSRFILKNTK